MAADAAGATPQPPFSVAVAVGVVAAIGKIGDCSGPLLAAEHPAVLLALNANDLHCALTVPALSAALWFAVATVRRLSEDPLFFYVGWRYRDGALKWLRGRAPGAAEAIDRTEPMMRRAATAIVCLDPGAVVCTLAGASRMQPARFVAANVAGTVARLALIRTVASAFPEYVETLLSLMHQYQRYGVAVAVLVTAVGVWRALTWRGPEQ
eukprot:TRINITY_DN29822_c0_g1_i1.p1 TRINITY_DN29822_c0_g1~~TRINITY_DN29822_c0_g1_i1.p1  ORF type:complete len:209 (+),score=50.31 TRINITY_DN29822_c0_g1_i1:46-672(+)